MERLDVQPLLEQARRAGYEAEIYVREQRSTSVRIQDGQVDQFTVAEGRGAGMRVIRDGREGYAYSEDLSVGALGAALEEAEQNAGLLPDEGARLEEFGQTVPELDLSRPELASIPLADKLELAHTVDRVARACDPRIKNVTGAGYGDVHMSLRLITTRGVDRLYRASAATLSVVPLVTAAGQHKNYYQVRATRDLAELDPEALAREAVARAVAKLGAVAPRSGHYPVVFGAEAMSDLLGVFAGIFSGEAAQEGKSLLRDRVGMAIASPAVTLIDDPLASQGMAARPFDDEGCPSAPHTLIAAGVFRGFLHNSETARRAGVPTTGHASRAGYKGTLMVARSCLCLAPGSADLATLLAPVHEGLMVTEVTGLHAGANAISGDFSLQAQGFMIRGGALAEPVHLFTVSGNYYDMLAQVEAVGSEVEWSPSSVATPPVRVSALAIAGA